MSRQTPSAAVELCQVAEQAHAELPEDSLALVYVLGTEVPIPSGERADGAAPAVTRAADIDRTLTLADDVFRRQQAPAA